MDSEEGGAGVDGVLQTRTRGLGFSMELSMEPLVCG